MGRARTRRRLPESRPAAVDDSKTDDCHSVNSELYSDCIEGELQKQIELQIEKITSFADSHTIEVTSPLKQHGSSRTRGCNVSRRVDISNVPAVTKEIEEIMPCSDPKRPRLSPLAARAALAASLQGFASVNLVQSALVTKLSQGGPLKNISVNFTLESSVFQPTEITPIEIKKMNQKKLCTKVLPVENPKSGNVIQHIDEGLIDISRNLASEAAGSVEENVSTHFVKTGNHKLVNPGHGNQAHRKGIRALDVRRRPRHSVADNDQVPRHTVLENQRNAKPGKFTKEESPPRSLAKGSLQNKGLKQSVAGPKLPKDLKSISIGILHVRRSPRHSSVDNDQVSYHTVSKDQRNDELEKLRQEEIPQETPPGSVSSGNTCEVNITYKSPCYNKTPTEQSVPDRHVRQSPRLNVNGKEENLHLKASLKDVERVTSETNAVWRRTTRFSDSNFRKK